MAIESEARPNGFMDFFKSALGRNLAVGAGLALVLALIIGIPFSNLVRKENEMLGEFGSYIQDNIIVNSGPIPAPGAIALLGLAGLGGLASHGRALLSSGATAAATAEPAGRAESRRVEAPAARRPARLPALLRRHRGG